MSSNEWIQKAHDVQALIESEADPIEQACTMSQPVVEAIEQTGLFRMGTPRELGGLEADVETIMGVCEALSFADGAVGWAFTQNTIAATYGEAITAIEAGAPDETCSELVRETKAAANHVVKAIAQPAAVFAWEASGSAGMRNPSRLQRCFRDLHNGAGHQVFDDRNYREVAKSSLGLEPAPF